MRDVLQRIEERLSALDLTPRAASLKAGLSGDAIRNLQRAVAEGGRKGVTTRTINQLAPALQTTPGWLLTGEGDGTTDFVPVVGYVSAGSVAVLYDVGQGNLDMVPAPKNSTPHTVAAEVRGDSLGPVLDGWLVFYDDVRSPVTEDLIGALCVVGLPDGRVMVKELKRAGDGHFHLLSNTSEAPLLDQEVEWAAKVTNMAPR